MTFSKRNLDIDKLLVECFKKMMNGIDDIREWKHDFLLKHYQLHLKHEYNLQDASGKEKIKNYYIRRIKEHKIVKNFDSYLYSNISNTAVRKNDRVKLVVTYGDITKHAIIEETDVKKVEKVYKDVAIHLTEKMLGVKKTTQTQKEIKKEILDFFKMHWDWCLEFSRIPMIVRRMLSKYNRVPLYHNHGFLNVSGDKRMAEEFYHSFTTEQKEKLLQVKKFNLDEIRGMYYLLDKKRQEAIEKEYREKFGAKTQS